jgi:dolichol-phosphate mannosyltransferase
MSGRVCILLPVLNEAQHVEPLCTRIGAAMATRPFTICFVDDGSTDGTVELVQARAAAASGQIALIRRRKTMRGSQRGSALLAALHWALSHEDVEYIIEMDGDLSHRPEELPKGLTIVESGQADVAIASKYGAGSAVINRPVSRRGVSRACNAAVRCLLDSAISDYSNGYRFYNRSAGLAIVGSRIRYGSPIYLSEAMAIWLNGGFRIAEFPSTYVGRNEGISKLRPLDFVKAAVAVVEIAWRYHTGRFGVLAAPGAPANASATSHEDPASAAPPSSGSRTRATDRRSVHSTRPT